VLILSGLHGRFHEYTFFPHTEVEVLCGSFQANVRVHKFLSFTRRCWYCVRYTGVIHAYSFFPHTEVERVTLFTRAGCNTRLPILRSSTRRSKGLRCLHGCSSRLRILPPHGGRKVYVVYTEIGHVYTHSSPTRRSKYCVDSRRHAQTHFFFSQVGKRWGVIVKVKRINNFFSTSWNKSIVWTLVARLTINLFSSQAGDNILVGVSYELLQSTFFPTNKDLSIA